MGKQKYNYLIVGSGLFGSVFAHQMKLLNQTCLVVEKRPHIGGNVYCDDVEGINVHHYGAHIFHTDNKEVWDFVNSFVPFNRYTNSPIAVYQNQLYNLPFNMNTFHQLWKVITPEQAKQKLDEQRGEYANIVPKNLEEQALKLCGRDIYEKLIKGYTEKQWGRKATELPAFIIRRVPLRFTYDNNYFTDAYQGIPIGGYNRLVERLLEGIEVRTETDYLTHREELDALCEKVVYTGPIDAYFDYKYGELEYRSLRFEVERLETENYQGNAVMNYTEREIPYTRIIEHKHFEFGHQPFTVITREYPAPFTKGSEPYYPINDEKNTALLKKYRDEAAQLQNVTFGGRLGQYAYFDMDDTVGAALHLAEQEKEKMI
jgi:UDP-galactopyranose mutase